ncbi:Influenza virus NS1A-binding protein-like protein [Trichoplax sp. H2]|nr:Influenza virus NS1A-binding protein-like protein [Trichoplax sp. H2]|eukprot:RDD43453.1 Influenza virus NS1A-binding protein-like protein [Trichoplax sp. H2]
MATENLHFNDNRHLINVVHSLDKLRIQQELCDIQLVADDGKVNAHRILLAVSSGYIKQMLRDEDTADLSSYRVEGVDKLSLETIIDFIYSGTINITPEQVLPIFRASNKLQISSISEACYNYLQSNVDLNNCLDIRTLASSYSCSNLIVAADKFISNNIEQVARLEAFLNLPQLRFEIYIDEDAATSGPSGEQYAAETVKWLHKNANLLNRQRNRLGESIQYLFLIENGELTDIDNLSSKQLSSLDESVRQKALQSRYRNDGLSSRPSSPTAGEKHTPEKCVNSAIAVRQLILSPQDNSIFSWHVVAVGETSDKVYAALVAIDNANLITVSLHLKSPESLLCRSSINGSGGSVKMSLLGSMQRGRCSFGVTVLNNEVYAVGGYDRLGCLNVVEKYNLASNTWLTCQPVNQRHGRIAVAASSDHVYALGGSHASHDLKSCERYDPITDSWKPFKSMRIARSCLGATVIDDQIFAIGGQNDKGTLSNVEICNIASNSWNIAKPMIAARSHLGVATEHKDRGIYAVGGCDKWSAVVNSVEYYDAGNDVWNPIVDMKIKRRGAGATTYEGLLYVCGGSDGSQPLNSIECFDPRANKWILLKEHMNHARVNVGIVNVDGWIYAIGGFDGSTFLNNIERFNPSTNRWTSIVTDNDDGMIAL